LCVGYGRMRRQENQQRKLQEKTLQHR
jgi:hypothetical protein